MSPLKPCAPDYEKHSELSKQNPCQRGLPCFPRLSGKMSGGISGSFTVIFYTGADLSERDAANSYTQPARWMDRQTDRAAGLNCQQVLRHRHNTGPVRCSYFLILTEEEERVCQIPQEQEQI